MATTSEELSPTTEEGPFRIKSLRQVPLLERAIFWPLLAIVLLAPLPIASDSPWAWSMLALLIGILLMAWGILVVLGRGEVAVPLSRIWIPALLFGLATIWVLIQMTSWTPSDWHHPLWDEAGRLLNRDLDGSVSVDTYQAASYLMRWLTYAGVFWLALQFSRQAEVVNYAVIAIVVASVVYAVYGLVIDLSGSNTVLWYEKAHYRDVVSSTFVNRAAYAAYAGLGLLCTTAIIMRRALRFSSAGLTGRERIRVLVDEMFERGWPLLLAWILIAMALLLSESRGGFISIALGLLAFFIALGLSPVVSRRANRVIATLVVTVVLVFVIISGGQVAERLIRTNLQDAQSRTGLYEMTAEAIADEPMLGTGLGSFEYVFHVYRGQGYYFRLRSTKAHNTYLENALELGVPAASALTLSVAALAITCLLGVRRRRRGLIYPAIGVAGTVGLSVHSLVDFPLQVPAVAVTYFLIMGLAVGQCWSSRDSIAAPG